jgi:hypothetical protein
MLSMSSKKSVLPFANYFDIVNSILPQCLHNSAGNLHLGLLEVICSSYCYYGSRQEHWDHIRNARLLNSRAETEISTGTIFSKRLLSAKAKEFPVH